MECRDRRMRSGFIFFFPFFPLPFPPLPSFKEFHAPLAPRLDVLRVEDLENIGQKERNEWLVIVLPLLPFPFFFSPSFNILPRGGPRLSGINMRS